MPIPIALLLIGFLFYFVGQIALLVAAFKESVVWGLCVLIIPFAALVFLIKCWEAAKQPFLVAIMGGGLIGAGLYLGRNDLSKDKNFAQIYAKLPPLFAGDAAPDKKEETPEQRHDRVKAEFAKDATELKAKYDALQTQWATVQKSGDKAGRAAFDKEAAAYAELRKKVEAEKAEAEDPAPKTSTTSAQPPRPAASTPAH